MMGRLVIIIMFCCSVLLTVPGADGQDDRTYPFYYDAYYQQQIISGNVYAMMFMNITADEAVNTGFHQILMSGYEGADVRMEIPRMGIDWYIRLNSTARNTRYPGYNLTQVLDLVYTLENRTAQNNAIVVTASKPIHLYGTRSNQGSTEGYLALPLMEESTSFWLTSYKTSHIGVSSFAIASVLDGACVEGYRVNGTHYTRVFSKKLAKNEVYIESERDEDYSGILVNSTRPIAVFSGHECAQVPVYTRFCDHLIEQIPPANNLGTYFIVPPIYGRSAQAGYEVRIVATDNDTEINVFATNERVYLHRGLYHHSTAQTDATIPTVVTCSKPCVVTQYNKGKRANPAETKYTDPYMMIIPPVSHWDKDATLTTSNYFQRGTIRDFENWLAVVCRTRDRFGMRFDGASIGGPWIDMAEGYSVASFRISPGVHRVSNDNPDTNFTGFAYGHSTIEPTAYGYPIAYKLFGTPLKGTWYRTLFNHFQNDTGPSVTATPIGSTPAPGTSRPETNRRCTLVNLYSSYLGVTRGAYNVLVLVGSVPQGSSACVNAYYSSINANIRQLKNFINDRICLFLMCDYTNHTFVHDVKVYYQPGASTFTLTITMVSGGDDRLQNSVACKLQVRDFIEKYAANWKTIVPAPPGCADVIFTRRSSECGSSEYHTLWKN